MKEIKLKKIRVPEPIGNLYVTDILTAQSFVQYKLPLFLESVSAGFPSPADDYLQTKLDLNELLVKNYSSTFFVRVVGDSMKDVGVFTGDILVVDRSLEAKDGNIVIAIIDGELTVKRLNRTKNKIFLLPENNDYKPIEITEQMQFEVWGVVRTVVHSLL